MLRQVLNVLFPILLKTCIIIKKKGKKEDDEIRGFILQSWLRISD